MSERRVVEDVVDAEGWIVQSGYTAWDCACGNEVRRYRGDITSYAQDYVSLHDTPDDMDIEATEA